MINSMEKALKIGQTMQSMKVNTLKEKNMEKES
jgi:hypothetical protein